MIPLPSFLKRFQRQAKEYVTQGLVKDLEFSGGTYQVMVLDPETNNSGNSGTGTHTGKGTKGKEEWVFLQFDKQGRLKDSFCSCAESEANRACVHQAVAFKYVYSGHSLPLHLRFERSLWNQLCRQFADEYVGLFDNPKTVSKGHYTLGKGKNPFFSIKAHHAAAHEKLENIFFNRGPQTEENSLKFSNLSEDELILWQKGRPPQQLAYELSFWSDLAKTLMAMQEGGENYSIAFTEGPKKLPNHLKVHFDAFSIDWVLSEEALTKIIPALTTVKSPLKVHRAFKKGIKEIKYDKDNHRFIAIAKSAKEKSIAPKGISIGDWTYVSGDGFYAKQTHLTLDQEELNDVENALNNHLETIKAFCDIAVHDATIQISYALSFDEQWNLHIEGYLFSPGDLSSPGSHGFNSWVYLDNQGFYRVEGRYFDEVKTVIPALEIANFVGDNRTWLNSQSGFATHVTPIEADLSYKLREDSSLTFARSLNFHGDQVVSKDFGRWVYIPGEGFFSKLSMQTSLPLHSGTSIPADQIPFFIRRNREELRLVQGFFNSQCPIVKAKVNITLSGPQEVKVMPDYELLPEYRDKDVRFFDDFVYVAGEGFHELAPGMRLPERFCHPVLIDKDHLVPFIDTELDSLLPFAKHVDLELRKTFNRRLVADDIHYVHEESKLEYAMKLSYQSELGTLSVASLWWALKQGQRFIFSEAGLIDLSEKQFSWLRAMGKKKVDRRSNILQLTSLELLRLNAFQEIQAPPVIDSAGQRSLVLLKELMEFTVPVEPDLTGLKSILRPYQLMGVRWLWFLYHHGLSGLLCDDMGLGKTHQAMALLMACKNHWQQQDKSQKRHFLIVCPTSVMYHWQEKLSKYVPELRVWTYYGAKRSLDRFYQDSDILLTSYGVWRNEVATLSTMPFEVAIFDELQIAKNQTSRIYSALLKAKARMRLGMTGTPIENRLRELKSLFDLVLPSYMPAENDYRNFFIRPIEKDYDQERRILLSRLIKPFVLRRKKEDVLLDLPEKTEEIAHCDLLSGQRELYVKVLSASRDKIINELSNDATPIPYMHIFALLSHLKQICNHPAAYLKKPEEYKHYSSGKWELFVELLQEARESGQKVVVFSQYLAMLDILEEYMKEHHIGYATIRGSTTNRGEQLEQFNYNPKCEVFIGSLQAAGLGVDLTAASVVIHYDRWWNPARENQATDRVHRIGQTRGVQVFKLLTKGTLEEHIDFMITRKGQLLDDIVSIDDHQIVKKFDRQEMITLLKALPADFGS